MADTYHTSRRGILKGIPLIAAPAVMACLPGVAAGATGGSQIMPLFREWKRAWDAVDTDHIEDTAFEAAMATMAELDQRIAELPCRCVEDLAAKIISSTRYGDFALDGPTGDLIMAEISALVS